MTPRIIVSYDDTDNDRDALALGRLLAHGGADLSLAYVRHAHQDDPSREAPARALAAALGATVNDNQDEPADLLVVGSREGAPEGRVELSATASYAVETATTPVIAVPRGKPVPFAEPALYGA